MNRHHLESWAERAVQELQETADALEESGSDARGLQALIDEYDAISQGREPWLPQMQARFYSAPGLDAL